MDGAEKDYKQQIAALLDHYVDGRDVFIKNDWDQPLRLKSGPQNGNVTDNWLIFMEQVTGIIAKSKYGLSMYENEIDIVDSEQMLDLYTTVGMPDSYDHWSLGKNRSQMGAKHKAGTMGLAYELVINSNPSISYCMTTNSKTMMALVIAHAAQGHNAFFKNNELFKYFTNADVILADIKRFKTFVTDCEGKYGVERVETILDACHALQSHAVDHRLRPLAGKSRKQQEMRKAALELARERSLDHVIETTSIKRPDEGFRSLINDERDDQPLLEQNILRFLGNAAPHLQPWERQIINMFCDQAQYFYPQMRTKVGNEGFATYCHHTILNDLYDEKLMSGSMMMEFMASHTSVVFQPDADDPRYSGLNPYALGFAVLKDIERMCKEPTDEDRKWFPSIAGKQDYIAVIKDAAFDYHDETFIYQFLSPKVMRDFKLFAFKDDDQESDLEITAISEEDGYKQLRATLASQYDPATRTPDIKPFAYDERGDRTLMLKHVMHNRRPLEAGAAQEVLKHIYKLWKHPVILASFDENDKVVGEALKCAPDGWSIPRPGLVHKFLESGIHP